MESSPRHIHLKNMIAFCLMMHVVSGMASEGVTDDGYKHLAWAVSAFFMIVGASLLSSKLTREGHDIPAAGFIVLSIAQAASYGFIATHDAGQDQFGAVIAIFIPGLLLISLHDVVPLLLRIAGFISAVSFVLLAVCIYRGLDPQGLRLGLSLGGYLPMNVVMLGWAWLIYKNKL